MLNEQQLHQYGQRIDYPIVSRIPSIELLNELIWQHVTHIPFEGLAPHLGENIDITNLAAIFKKLVENKRGGWCYEMNGLFFHVLKTLGFDVSLQLASVYQAPLWLPASHSLLTVKMAEQSFLVDVGFGNFGLTQAIDLSSLEQSGQMKNGIDYQLTTSEEGYCFRAGFAQKMTDQYRFTLTSSSLTLKDLTSLQHEIMTSPASPFVRQRVVKIATSTGFKKLLNDEYTEYTLQEGMLNQTHRWQLVSSEDYATCLAQHFQLTLSSAQLLWIPPVNACQSTQSTIDNHGQQMPMINPSVNSSHALLTPFPSFT